MACCWRRRPSTPHAPIRTTPTTTPPRLAVLALCRTFALELSPNIRVACVSPGAVLTPMQEAEYTPEMLEEVNRSIPLGRHAQLAEIGAAFHYLASLSRRVPDRAGAGRGRRRDRRRDHVRLRHGRHHGCAGARGLAALLDPAG
ncbi:SDR family oxidoreductase [Nonomuraea ferruginea]